MIPLFDAHLDLAWSALHWNRDLTLPLEELRRMEAHMQDHPARGRGTVSLPELKRANVRVCLATILVRSKPEVAPPEGYSRRDLDYRNQSLAHAVGWGQLAYYHLLETQGHLQMLRTAPDLARHAQQWDKPSEEQPLGVILAMEGADPIVDPAQAQMWYDAGLRCVGLSHYAQGPYAPGTGVTGPLPEVGRRLLDEFARLGMIVDLTHCAEPAFFDVLDHFPGPVLASHNMCRALVPGDRQFSDEQLHRLLERDAVIGMAFDAWMLSPHWQIGRSDPSSVSLVAAADHIDYICQMAGSARHVAIGSDLDGGFGTEQTPKDLQSIADLQKLAQILADRGYPAPDIAAIFHGNWQQFFLRHLPPI